MPKNKQQKFCVNTSEMTKTEKGIMAKAIKSGEDQINFLRKPPDDSDEE